MTFAPKNQNHNSKQGASLVESATSDPGFEQKWPIRCGFPINGPNKSVLVFVLFYYDSQPHPRMNATLPLGNSLRQSGASSSRPGFCLPGLHKLIRGTFRLGHERAVWKRFGAFRSRYEIARQSIQRRNKSTTVFVDSGEGVSFAPLVLDDGLVSGLKLQPN